MFVEEQETIGAVVLDLLSGLEYSLLTELKNTSLTVQGLRADKTNQMTPMFFNVLIWLFSFVIGTKLQII